MSAEGAHSAEAELARSVAQARYPRHPGGARLLELARGHERADLLFLAYHLGVDLNAVVSAARSRGIPTEPLETSLFRELSAAAERARQGPPIFPIYCAGLALALPLAWLCYVVRLDVGSGLALAFCLLSYAFTIFHMRHHFGGRLFSFGARGSGRRALWGRRLDAWTGPYFDLLDETLCVSASEWIRIHQGIHHVFTNTSEDYDLRRPYPILRLHPRQPRKRYHRLQSAYAPLVLALNGLLFAVDNVLDKGGRRRHLVLHAALLIGLPAALHGPAAALAGYLGVRMAAGFVASYLFQISHNFAGAFAVPFEGHHPSFEDWVRQQVESSQSFGTHVTTLVLGGINLQTEHHVFPALDPLAAYRVKGALRALCARRGITYTWRSSAWEAARSYHRHLARLGREDNPGDASDRRDGVGRSCAPPTCP